MSRFLRPILIVVVVLVCAGALYAEVRNRLPLATPAFDGIVPSGAGANGIPAITQPRFDDVKTADAYLSDDGLGIDLAIGSAHRFYPYQILVWHEVVNDELNGVPVAVTYDPLCGSNVVFDRRVGDTTLTFEVAETVQNNNLMILGSDDAVRTQLADTSLTRLSSTVVSWKTFKSEHPNAEVLSRSTGAIRDYTSNPYGDYALNNTIYFPLTKMDGSRPAKEVMMGENGEQMYWFCWVAFHSDKEPI